MELSASLRAELNAALAAEPDWQALLRHFDLDQGFSFILLLVDSSESAALCREALEAHLNPTTPYVIQLVAPRTPALLRNLPDLLHHTTAWPSARALWVESVVTEGDASFEEWKSAWRACFAGLNPIRNTLQRNLNCALVFAGAPWTQVAIRESAPDLWSIRSTVARVSPRVSTLEALPIERTAGNLLSETANAPDPDFALQMAETLRGKPGREARLAQMLTRAGKGFLHRNQFGRSISALEEALALAESNFPNSPDHLSTLELLGRALLGANQFKKAELVLLRGLEMAKLVDQPDNPYAATALNNLANVYRATQRMSQAETAYSEALAIRRKLAEANPDAYLPYVANSLNHLANLYRDTQRMSQAETAYSEALAIRRKLADANPDAYLPYVAGTLNNLGLLYRDTQRLSQAETAYSEALAIYRKLADANPDAYLPVVATTLNNLAGLYRATQRLSQAETACSEALAIRRKLADAHPDAYLPYVAGTLNNLAFLQFSEGSVEAAEASASEAIGILEPLWQANPELHGNLMARILWARSLIGEAAGRPAEACALARRALAAAYDPAIKKSVQEILDRLCPPPGAE